MNWLLGVAFAALTVALFTVGFTVAFIRGGTRLPDSKPPTPAQRHQAELAAAEERLFPGTDASRFSGGCSYPPCEIWEDVEVLCNRHMGSGKHHPPPLRYGPAPVVADMQLWEQELDA